MVLVIMLLQHGVIKSNEISYRIQRLFETIFIGMGMDVENIMKMYVVTQQVISGYHHAQNEAGEGQQQQQHSPVVSAADDLQVRVAVEHLQIGGIIILRNKEAQCTREVIVGPRLREPPHQT